MTVAEGVTDDAPAIQNAPCQHASLRYPNPKPVYGDVCVECGYTYDREANTMSEEAYEEARGIGEATAIMLLEALGEISTRQAIVELERLYLVHGFDPSVVRNPSPYRKELFA